MRIFKRRTLCFFAVLLCTVLIAGCSAKQEKTYDSSISKVTTSPESGQNSPDASDNSANTEEASDAAQDSDLLNRDNNENPEMQEETGAKTFNVVLDPGHGGKFSGAVFDGRTEKELALRITEYAAEYLKLFAPDINIFMTRSDDSTMSDNVVEDLELRAEFAKEMNADIYVSFHLNATDKHDQSGGMVLISHRANVNEASAALGNAILSELSVLGISNRGLVTRNSSDHFDENGNPLEYYAINRHCANRDIPGIIVEHCFIDNSTDIGFIDSEEDLRRMGEADARGIIAYLDSLK